MLALALLTLLQATPDDAAATAALDKFKSDYKSRDVAQRVSAVTELAKTPHDKVIVRLSQLLGVDEPEVRVAAAKGLGEQTENRKKSSVALAGAISPNLPLVQVAVAILEQLGTLKEDVIAPEVEKHFAKADPLDVQKAAIVASGKIRSLTSIDPLIKLLRELELEAQQSNTARGAGKVKGVGGKGIPGKAGAVKNGNADERDRAMELLPAIRAALTAITNTTCQDAKDWEAWWNEHRGTFRVEK
jgi:HEAT repeat protein